MFTFHLGGYQLIFWLQQKQATEKLLARLDASEYQASETLVLSLPLTLPYPIYQSDYERVYGDFSYQGTEYKLVKQKLENDTLFIVCIRDEAATRLSKTQADFEDLTQSLPSTSRSTQDFISKLCKDYTALEGIALNSDQVFLYSLTQGIYTPSLLAIYIATEGPPPKFV